MNPKISLLNLGTTKSTLAAAEAPEPGFDVAMRQAQNPNGARPPETGPPDPNEPKAPPGSPAGQRPERPDKPSAETDPAQKETAEGEVAIQEPNAPSQTPDLLPQNSLPSTVTVAPGTPAGGAPPTDEEGETPTTEQWVLSLTAETGAGMFQVLPTVAPQAIATVPTVVLGESVSESPIAAVTPISVEATAITGATTSAVPVTPLADNPDAPNGLAQQAAVSGPVLDADPNAVLPTTADAALPKPSPGEQPVAAPARSDASAAPTATQNVPSAADQRSDAPQTGTAIVDVARQAGFAAEEIVRAEVLPIETLGGEVVPTQAVGKEEAPTADPKAVPSATQAATTAAEDDPTGSKTQVPQPIAPDTGERPKGKSPLEPGTDPKIGTGEKPARGLFTSTDPHTDSTGSKQAPSRVGLTTTDPNHLPQLQAFSRPRLSSSGTGPNPLSGTEVKGSDTLMEVLGGVGASRPENPLPAPATQLAPTPSVASSVPAAAPAEAKLAPEVSERIAMQIGERLEMLVATRPRAAVRVQLDPVDLGSLTITVKSRGASVDAHVTTTNEQVRAALEMQRPQLIQQLDNRGLQLNSLNVGSQTPNGQTPSDGMPRQQSGQPAPHAASNPGAQTAAVAAPTRSAPVSNGRGVDLVI